VEVRYIKIGELTAMAALMDLSPEREVDSSGSGDGLVATTFSRFTFRTDSEEGWQDCDEEGVTVESSDTIDVYGLRQGDDSISGTLSSSRSASSFTDSITSSSKSSRTNSTDSTTSSTSIVSDETAPCARFGRGACPTSNASSINATPKTTSMSSLVSDYAKSKLEAVPVPTAEVLHKSTRRSPREIVKERKHVPKPRMKALVFIPEHLARKGIAEEAESGESSKYEDFMMI
jgi:hypothetical protein